MDTQRSGLSLIDALGFLASEVPALAIDRIDSPNINKGEFDLEYNGYPLSKRQNRFERFIIIYMAQTILRKP